MASDGGTPRLQRLRDAPVLLDAVSVKPVDTHGGTPALTGDATVTLLVTEVGSAGMASSSRREDTEGDTPQLTCARSSQPPFLGDEPTGPTLSYNPCAPIDLDQLLTSATLWLFC